MTESIEKIKPGNKSIYVDAETAKILESERAETLNSKHKWVLSDYIKKLVKQDGANKNGL
jgi:hypothetical protein